MKRRFDPFRYGRVLVLFGLLFFLSEAGTGVFACAAQTSTSIEWIGGAPNRKGFVRMPSGKAFVPWGFNYDHDEGGRLIEAYWDAEWAKVEADFGEMRDLGANVVRVHLQVGRFLKSATEPDDAALERLGRLVRLAERTGLYLDLTGLGCYEAAETPAWYDALSERERWAAQTAFWEAVARVCASSPAVFCYDLMNEPVVPGGQQDNWLGLPFAGKCFVQFITRDLAGRERPEVARQWVEQLTAAIRRVDTRHLVTVGLVPWSLDRPGLTSGFVPSRVADPLDFVAVHLYPESGKVDEALKTLEGFSIGKPVVVEEMFPLSCPIGDLEQFIRRSRPTASGWIGFYWGQTAESLRQEKTIPAALTLGWLELFEKLQPVVVSP
jgi:hypothetical protein